MDQELKDKIDRGIKKFMSDDRHFEKPYINLYNTPNQIRERMQDGLDYEEAKKVGQIIGEIIKPKEDGKI